jgi:hypothetical protein
MPLATKNNAIIVKDGKLAEDCGCCDPCGSFPDFIRVSHNLPSSPSGGDFFDSSPRYCTQSIPSILQLSRIDQRDNARVVQIECGYTGQIAVCSLPSSIFQTIAGINQIIVDLPNKRLFVWHEVDIPNTSSGVTQASLLYATTDEVSLESDTIATFQTQSIDGILGSSCVIGAGYTITVSKSEGPLEPVFTPIPSQAIYKDASGRWYPGAEITLNLPARLDSGQGYFLDAGDYVLRYVPTVPCLPHWQLSLPLPSGVNPIYRWFLRATLRPFINLPSTKCSGCTHSFVVEISIPGLTGVNSFWGSNCASNWSESVTARRTDGVELIIRKPADTV